MALLILLTVIGLLGAVPRPQWSGASHARATAVGLALEAVLAGLLIATFRRTDGTEVARKLRLGLRYLLAVAMAVLAIALIVSLHLHLAQPVYHNHPPSIGHSNNSRHIEVPPPGKGRLPAWVLFLLLSAVLVAAVWAALKLGLRRPATRRPPRGGLAIDPESLRDALSEGAAALRDAHYDDARKAIIACYVAMERSLADAGAEKADADTPDELLARATAAGLIHGSAARELTSLFYEARFSTHPLGGDKRGQATRALDELAAGLKQMPA